MDIRTNAISTIAGMRGSGKTTLALRILKGVKGPKIVYDPMHEYPEDISFWPESDSQSDFNLFLETCWDRGNIYICVDEAERYFKGKKSLTEFAAKIVNTGRHRNIGLLVITRRIAELNKTTFGLSEVVIFFQMFLPNDIKYINEFFPNADQLQKMKKYKYKVFTMR
jgi:DNA helicase HerA-like ATPase